MEFKDLINKNIKLKKIFREVEPKLKSSVIEGITNNSKNIKKNYLFVAIKGNIKNGNDYIDIARKNGSCIIISTEKKGNDTVTLQNVDIKEIYSLLCSAFYERKPSNIVGVTGTNGKTSVVEFCRQIWDLTGWKSASLGTLGTIISGEKKINSDAENLTTLDASKLNYELNELSKNNVTHLALEASSHGLIQKRLEGINLCGAIFTNLSHDHLDYHNTFENYFKAKKMLFLEHLRPGSVVAINLDDKYGLKLYDEIKEKPFIFVNYGKHKLANLRIIETNVLEKSWQLKIKFIDEIIDINIGMLGEFQIYNALASASICIGLNMDHNFVLKSLSYLKSVSGRMQIITGHPRDALIVIDYAHTPDALEKAINALKLHSKGNIYTLFGCGGERDSKKREIMGRVSHSNSNFTIITDDNPRNESPEEIRKSILKGCPNGIEISGRDNAIKKAISLLKKNDTLLIAGKGHETTQTIGKESLPFDDFSVAKLAIKNLKNEKEYD